MRSTVGVVTGLLACVLGWPSAACAQVLRSWVSGIVSNYEGGRTFNSSGGDNTVTQIGVGRYRAVLRGIGGSGGTVQVSVLRGLGAASNCNVEAWAPTWAGDQEIFVRCFDNAGRLADTRFNVFYHNNPPLNVASPPAYPGSGELGYAWVGYPLSANAAPAEYASGPTVVTRNRFVPGRYSITPTMLRGTAVGSWGAEPPLHLQVTTYGPLPARCSVKESAGIFVQCVDYSGMPTDAMFTLLVLKGATPIARNPAGVATVILNAPGSSVGRTSSGASVSFTRVSDTQMLVFFPGIGSTTSTFTVAPMVSSGTVGVWCGADTVAQVGDGFETMVGCSGPGSVNVGLFR